jgi:hypothetical protein
MTGGLASASVDRKNAMLTVLCQHQWLAIFRGSVKQFAQ